MRPVVDSATRFSRAFLSQSEGPVLYLRRRAITVAYVHVTKLLGHSSVSPLVVSPAGLEPAFQASKAHVLAARLRGYDGGG